MRYKAQNAPNAIVNQRLPSWNPLHASASREAARQKDRTWWGTAKPNIGYKRPAHKACEGTPLQAGCAAGSAEQAPAREVRSPKCPRAPSVVRKATGMVEYGSSTLRDSARSCTTTKIVVSLVCLDVDRCAAWIVAVSCSLEGFGFVSRSDDSLLP